MHSEITFPIVCLFDGSNQSVLTTIGSGLQGPQGPSSTQLGDWDLLFKIGIVGEKLTEYIYIYIPSGRFYRVDGQKVVPKFLPVYVFA